MLPRKDLLVSDKAFLLALQTRYPIPDNYVVIDVETTGFKYGEDLIWDFAALFVRSRQAAESHRVLINLDDPTIAQEGWLDQKIANLAKVPTTKLGHVRLSKELLQQGESMTEGMRQIGIILDQIRDEKLYVVGHNFVRFDAKRIIDQLQEFTGKRFRFARTAVYDTAAVEKALQMNSLPTATEDPTTYFLRILNGFSSVKYSLYEHCEAKYKLQDRCQLPENLQHTAAGDCQVVHCLLENYRSYV